MISGIATGQTLQVVVRKFMAEGCFDVQKKIHSGERSMLFRCIFIMNGLDDVNTMELFVFFRITTRSYVMKYTDEPLFLPKAY